MSAQSKLFDDRGFPSPDAMRFNGSDYDIKRDTPRLAKQLRRVYDAMSDGQWHTLSWLADVTGDPPASVSAQLRHLRKARFGRHTIEKDYIANGLYKYRMPKSVNTL